MNERIKDLIKAAGGIGHDDDGQELTPMLVGSGIEKFAELIVRKCADVGERYADGNYEVFNQILEHFGLEEE